jgi:hypothetical protein
MNIAIEIRKLHEVSKETARKRLVQVRKQLGLTIRDEVTLDQYLKVYKK